MLSTLCASRSFLDCSRRSIHVENFVILKNLFSSSADSSNATDDVSSQPFETKINKPKVIIKANASRKSSFKLEKKLSYNIHEAAAVVKELSWTKFDESVDLAINLGVDPRKPNQSIKSVAKLPKGTGKLVRVCVFATGEAAQAAREAGAEVVGAEDVIALIQGGDIGFDRAIATPDMMAQVGKIGKILGPRGLMPNPKMGTVTTDVAKAVKAAKAGSVQFRVDKHGTVHSCIGKVSFSVEDILENIRSFMIAVGDAKPEGFKGKYLLSAYISSSMGPGLKIDLPTVDPSNAKFMLDASKLEKKS